MSESIVKRKSYNFAIEIINLYKWLVVEKREYVLSRQLLRSGTSVGANIREALNGQSNADFIHKLSISQKECDESLYWLELLFETKYLNELQYNKVCKSATELLKMLKSIILTSKKKANINS